MAARDPWHTRRGLVARAAPRRRVIRFPRTGRDAIVGLARLTLLVAPPGGMVCASPHCAAGACTQTLATKGAPCNDDGGVVCDGAGKCIATHCGDGVKDGNETELDCGETLNPVPILVDAWIAARREGTTVDVCPAPLTAACNAP